MITLTISCSKCGKELHPAMDFSSSTRELAEEIRDRLDESGSGWIVEENGDNIDTYCSRQCAE